MGNCQTAEVATVVIQHPGGPPYKSDMIHRPISALEVMDSNPGHYVARLIHPTNAPTATSARMKLLTPNDVLHVGSVYRLIPFEDVVKEFASSEKGGKPVKLVKERDMQDMSTRVGPFSDPNPGPNPFGYSGFRGNGQQYYAINGRSEFARLHQWKPALQSIAEFGN